MQRQQQKQQRQRKSNYIVKMLRTLEKNEQSSTDKVSCQLVAEET